MDINIFIRASNFIKYKTKAITKIYWLHWQRAASPQLEWALPALHCYWPLATRLEVQNTVFLVRMERIITPRVALGMETVLVIVEW